MRLADQSPRLLAAISIAFAHGLAIYGLLIVAPRAASTTPSAPIAVHFIAQSEPPPNWTPPQVKVIPPALTTTAPELPLAEFSEAPLARAITAPPPVSSAPPPPDRSVPKLVSAVEYLREPSPRYPPQSRRLREQGIVVLRVLIDERGQACDIAIETSSGYERLDRAAREAVASAAFRPYFEDGAPRRALVLIPIEFFLNRGSA